MVTVGRAPGVINCGMCGTDQKPGRAAPARSGESLSTFILHGYLSQGTVVLQVES